jgi:hypothetical protein
MDGGVELQPGNEWAEIVNAVDDKDARALLIKSLNTVTGSAGLGGGETLRAGAAVLRTAASLLMMQLVVPKSLGDLAFPLSSPNPTLRAAVRKTTADHFASMFDATKKKSIAAQEAMFASMGLLIDATTDRFTSDLSELRDMGTVTGKANKLQSVFYRNTGIHWFTNFARSMVLHAGIAAMGEQAAIANSQNTTPAERKKAAEFFDTIGVSMADFELWNSNGRLSAQAATDAKKFDVAAASENIARALQTLRNQHIAQPASMDGTVWAHTAVGSLLFLFHSYFYAVSNQVLPAMLKPLRDGGWKHPRNYTHIATFAALGIALSSLGLYMAAQATAGSMLIANPVTVFAGGDGNLRLPESSILNADETSEYLSLAMYPFSGLFATPSWFNSRNNVGDYADLTNLSAPLGMLDKILSGDPYAYFDNAVLTGAVMGGGYAKDKLIDARQESQRLREANKEKSVDK